MLVLTRTVARPDESVRPENYITIDGPARISVLRVDGKLVRLGIEADKTVRVRRGELDHEKTE